MRRFIDEDETPAGTRRGRRNRAADSRHGFGSPDGMELKDIGVEHRDTGGSRESGNQSQQALVRSSNPRGATSEYQNMNALVDLESPPPILTLSTESETPTPPALTQGGRMTPPDVADELIKGETTSPVINTLAKDAELTPPRIIEDSPAVKTPSYPQSPMPGFYASPATSNISTSSSPHQMATPTLPSFRSSSHASPMALDALRSTNIPRLDQEVIDPVQMGTPRKGASISAHRRRTFSDVATTPERSTNGSNLDDSASDSDASIKEPFSDQVKSLNKLLLSTGKRLGKLGHTSWTPDQDNDNLTKEEEDLEEVRRQLQEELSMVDYGILKDSPNDTPSRTSKGSVSSYQEVAIPESESPNIKLNWSQLDQIGSSTPAVKAPTHQKNPQGQISPSITPSSIDSVWGRESVPSTTTKKKIPPKPPSPSSGSPNTKPFYAQRFPADELEAKFQSTARQQSPTKASIPITVLKANQNKNSTSRITERAPFDEVEVEAESAQPLISKLATFRTGASSRKPPTPRRHGAANNLESSRSSSIPLEDPLAPGGGNSGYISSSVDGSLEQDDINSLSSPANSELGYAPLFDEESQKKPSLLLRRDPKSKIEDKLPIPRRIQPSSPQARQIHQMEANIDAGTLGSVLRIGSGHARHEIAPEPPQPTAKSFRNEANEGDHDYSRGPIYTRGLLESFESVLLPKPDDSSIEKSRQDDRASLVTPKSTQMKHTNLAYPSDERQFGFKMEGSFEDLKSDDVKLISQFQDAAQSPSSIATLSQFFPSDEREFGKSSTTSRARKNGFFNRFSTKRNNEKSAPLAQKMSPGNKLRAGEDEPSWLVQTSDLHAGPKATTPIKIEKLARIKSVIELQLSDSPMETLLFTEASPTGGETPPFASSKIPFAHTEDDLEVQEISSSHDTKKALAKRRQAINVCCLAALLLVTAGVIIPLFLAGILGPKEISSAPTISPFPSISPSLSTLAPSLSIFPSTKPTDTESPTTQVPSNEPSFSPTARPTVFSISFESVYEIFIRDGLISEVPRENYESDLISSLDRLLDKAVANLPTENSRSLLERHLVTAVLPSEINAIETTDCPNQDTRNKCEKVFAYITLQDQDAAEYWADLKLALELGIAIGQLQFELDQVNPNSPVAIIDLIPESQPAPTPSMTPSMIPSAISSVPSTYPSISTTHFPSVPPSSAPSLSALVPPAVSQTPTSFDLFAFLTRKSFDGGQALETPGSAQNRAYLWLLGDSFLQQYSEERLLQRYALSTFFYSTRGENWFFKTNWLTDVDECFWYSRSPRRPCDRFGRYQNLELDYNNLNGQLPPELGLLSNSLERMILRGGPITFTSGTLPSELGYLTNLEYLYIRGNQYSGSLPTQIGFLTSLQQLDISGNLFTGALPPHFFSNNLELSIVDVSNNRFTGRIPTEIGNLARQCRRLNIENNLLTGPLPTEIGNLRGLQSFHGGSNILSSLPSEIGRLTFLDTLQLEQNAFTGTIPSEISRMQRLLILDLSLNSFSGQLSPRTFSLMLQLYIFRHHNIL